MMDKSTEFTIDDGYEAHNQGIPRDRNPYIALLNYEDWKAWFRGWDEAKEILESKKTDTESEQPA